MIHHQIRDDDCISSSDVMDSLKIADTVFQTIAFEKIQTYVLVTVFVLLLQLGHLIKPFAYGFFRLLSWISYILVPVLISYILGLMGRPESGYGTADQKIVDTFRYLTCVWAIFLLFAYAGFDNLNAFSLQERDGRSKLVLQIGIQFSLLLLIIRHLPLKTSVLPVVCALLVLTFKFLGRVIALAHSAGATPRIKDDVVRIINYMNREDVDDSVAADPVTMAGFDYLVGAKYVKIEDGRIVDGITMENLWGTEGRLLASSNMQLKDTCLSFALFWLLLGKFWSYPLYGRKSLSSRAKAWKLVRHGLLSEKGSHERVFRVIEVELSFLRDYFHARYIFFYLNGFYWKLISVIALPAMFWWFIQKSITSAQADYLYNQGYGKFTFTRIANSMVISVIVALEVMQIVVFLTSRWLKVTLYCFYVKTMATKSTGCIARFLLEIIGAVFLGSSRSSNSAWWRKPWKRELDQYSLVQSCTTVLKSASSLKWKFISVVGIPLSKPGRKQGRKVVLSEQVKEAVVLCLQRNDTYPKLSNGVESLRRNGLMGMLPNWAFTLESDTEMILVWHIATSVCELHHDPSTSSQSKDADNMKVATNLSKYCAYLLFFAPSLLPVLALEAETLCDSVAKEAKTLFKKPIFGCRTEANNVKYEKLMDLISDEEVAGGEFSVLTKGAILGKRLLSFIGDEEKRWKILAELWAEMILYLAPSNNNEMDHAGKLSQGGEFITQLWALLIHAGISNRDDMVEAFEQAHDAY